MSTTTAPTPTYSSTVIPREFVGRGRQFRAKIDAEDSKVQPVITSILSPLRQRLQRGGSPAFRPDTLITASRRYERELPAFGRLSLSIERTRSELVIVESRCSAGRFHHKSWFEGAMEPDILISQIKVIARTGHFEISAKPLASVALHTLSRWFQRNFDTSESTLRADLREIVRHHADIVRPGKGRFFIAAGDGHWRGSVESTLISSKTLKLLCVRSFVPGDESSMAR